MLKIRGAALVAATALVMGGVAGCGDEGEPAESSSTVSPSAVEPSSSSEGSGSSTSSSGSSGPEGDGDVVELPAAAEERTKEGAIAFNKFYFAETGRALTTGKTDHLRKYSDNCLACDDFLKTVDQATADGTRMNRNPTSVAEVSAKRRSDSGYRVELEIRESAYYEVLKDGSKGRTADAASLTLVTDTQWTGQGWVMRDQVRTK